jgi:ATP-dependent RNA helicase RhlE
MDLMQQRHVDLHQVEVLVLDEADRMLDMGFLPDIRRIVAALPPTGQRQTLLFSATLPPDIRALAAGALHQPVNIEVAAPNATADHITQFVYFVDRANKPHLIVHLLKTTSVTRALVFTRTKHGADRVVRQLYLAGIHAEAIHGNKSQGARQRALANFQSGKTPVLIASDIAARGIDIDNISHVINYDLPNVPETYVHRIGRTARAGASGVAISFCDQSERVFLRDIERQAKVKIQVREDHPAYPAAPAYSAERPSHYPRSHAAEPTHTGHPHTSPQPRQTGAAPHHAGSSGSSGSQPRHSGGGSGRTTYGRQAPSGGGHTRFGPRRQKRRY